MLHVLTAQIVAQERERAIQRRLQEQAVRREAMAARLAPTAPGHDPATHRVDRPCGVCPPARATAG